MSVSAAGSPALSGSVAAEKCEHLVWLVVGSTGFTLHGLGTPYNIYNCLICRIVMLFHENNILIKSVSFQYSCTHNCTMTSHGTSSDYIIRFSYNFRFLPAMFVLMICLMKQIINYNYNQQSIKIS